MKFAVGALVSAVLASSAGAGQEPQPSLTSAEANVAFAVPAICVPYVLDAKTEAELPLKRPLVASDGWVEPTFQRMGVSATNLRVGFAGRVHVAIAAPGNARACELSASADDAQALRKVVLQALEARPERFAPTRSRYLPGSRFESEDMLCTAADSARPNTFVLLSTAHTPGMILLTLRDSPPRGEACDHEGVKMNFRTLAP